MLKWRNLLKYFMEEGTAEWLSLQWMYHESQILGFVKSSFTTPRPEFGQKKQATQAV